MSECPECHKYAGKCPACHRPRPPIILARECRLCGGNGEFAVRFGFGVATHTRYEKCIRCNGTGVA